MKNVQKYGSGLGLFALSGLALAQTAPDVTAATTGLADAATAIGTIGVAMIVAASAGIVYKWVTAFLIG